MTAALLKVTGLGKTFVTGPALRRERIEAVRDVSFELSTGRTLALVGESGSGKTTVGRLSLALLKPTRGSVVFDGRDISTLRSSELRSLRTNMQMIFQDSSGTLNPRMDVESLLTEPFRIQRLHTKAERRRRALALLDEVGLHSSSFSKYAYEFSGGQRQRIGIARALALQPKLIVADEPVSSLDVSVQSQVLNLLKDLQNRHGISFLLISHDLPVIEFMSHHVAVMYLGEIVESGSREQIYGQPKHPYTQALLQSMPSIRATRVRHRPLVGEMPSAAAPPSGCSFHTRCPLVMPHCHVDAPRAVTVLEHRVACHLYTTSVGEEPMRVTDDAS